MKNNFLIIFIVIFTATCSIVPKAPSELLINRRFSTSLDQKAKMYPFWNVHFRGFDVRTPGKTLDVHEKRRMLRHMDLMRFTVNTPEFASNVLDSKRRYRSARNLTSRDGTRRLVVGEYYDAQRLLDIIRYRMFPFTIAKQYIIQDAAAIGVVGHSLYLEDFTSPIFQRWSWIAFPDRDYWNAGGYLNEVYLSSVIFHELLHNTGFTHENPIHPEDTVYQLQAAYRSTLNRDFYIKYQKQLEAFRPFYEELHSYELTFTTTLHSPTPSTTALSLLPEYQVPYFDDDEIIICILNEDGTQELRVIKASEINSL